MSQPWIQNLWKNNPFLINLTRGEKMLIRWSCIFALLISAVLNAGLAEAPDCPVAPASWSTGVKDFFGTSYESYDSELKYSSQSMTAPISKVWFTGAYGVLNEVYWPSVDMAQTRDSQILVVDGQEVFEERKNSISSTEWVVTGVPHFHITNRDPLDRFRIEKWVLSDPDRDVVLQRVRLQIFKKGLQFFWLHNPSVGNTPHGDFARVEISREFPALLSWQSGQAQALVSTLGFVKASSGFESCADSSGFEDLKKNGAMDYFFSAASNGNVVQLAMLDISSGIGTVEFDVALGFGSTTTAAYEQAVKSIQSGYFALSKKYHEGWQCYQDKALDYSLVSGDGGKLFRSSIAVLKSLEDKTASGAFIASPTVPWGEWTQDLFLPGQNKPRKEMTSGYHLVWPRDLYHMSTAFMAIGDFDSAIASLNYLTRIQLGASHGFWHFGTHKKSKDGSYAQNTWIDGESHWPGLQLDQVSVPALLSYRLWKEGKIDLKKYWSTVKRATDFVSEFGPWTRQERWEDAFGVSPSTLASEIAALSVSAEMAVVLNDHALAKRYHDLASHWGFETFRGLDVWTFTTTGGLGDGRYYERIEGASTYDQVWNPNDATTYELANQGGTVQERNVIDGGFLELVRLGVRSALNEKILATLPEYDENLRKEIKDRGPSFYRYTGDRYNYDSEKGIQTHGMLWPLLTGERGHYELARALALKKQPSEVDLNMRPYIRAMERFATPTFMLPEQVWDKGPRAGIPTGAATPLGWPHAEYIKLLRSLSDLAVYDTVRAHNP